MAACAPPSSPPGACWRPRGAPGFASCIRARATGPTSPRCRRTSSRASRPANRPIGTPGPLGRFLIRGEPGFQIIPELAPAPGEFVIDKTANSAFWGTDLAAILAAQGIRALILAGVTTDVCVHCTLREANDRGFECLVARDACGSGDAEAHRAALHMVTVEDGVFGALADVDAIVAALDKMDRALATASPKPSHAAPTPDRGLQRSRRLVDLTYAARNPSSARASLDVAGWRSYLPHKSATRLTSSALLAARRPFSK